MRTTWTRRLAVATAVAALAVAGCGDGSDDGESVDIVRDMDLLEGAEAAGTARLSWHADLESPFTGSATDDEWGLDTGITIHMVQDAEGVIDLTTHTSELAG